MTHALPNLQDLDIEGRPSADTRLRPVHGEGGLQHDAGAFVRSAQAGTGSDERGAEGVAAETASVFRHGGCWHARRILLNGTLVMGIAASRDGAIADLEAKWNRA